MKIKKYENFSFVLFICITTFILEFIFIIILCNNKEYKYERINTTVVKDNLVLLVIPLDNKNLLYKNKYLYFKDQKKKYKIVEERKSSIKQGNKKYYEILISFKFDKEYKSSDIMTISIKKEKYRIIEIFKLIWDGD